MDLFEEDGTLYAFKIQTEGEKKRIMVLEAPEIGLEFKIPKTIWDAFNAKYYHLYNLSQAPVRNTAGRDDKLYKRYMRIKKVGTEKPVKRVKKTAEKTVKREKKAVSKKDKKIVKRKK